MRKTFLPVLAVAISAAVSLAAVAPAAAATASSATTTAITSLTLTPPALSKGRVFLSAVGQNIERYIVIVDCPYLIRLKSGARDYCGTTRRVEADRLRRLWLNLKNPNHVDDVVYFTVQGIPPGADEPVVERTISLVIKVAK